MLLDLLFKAIIGAINALTSVLPAVYTLPFGADEVLSTGMGYFVFVAQLIPPFASMLTAFVAYYGFKIGLKFVAMIPWVRGILHK